eukprot:PITA_08031
MPLQPQVVLKPFEKWAVDFFGPFNPPSHQKVHILVCTDYVTKWVEARAVAKAIEQVLADFLFEEARYGLDLSEAQKHRLEQLNELDEIRSVAVQKTIAIQQQRMKWHDKLTKNKVFHTGDWAFLYDSHFKDFKGKLCTHWMRPYEVDAMFDNGTVRLVTIDDTRTSFLVNGHRLKLCHPPTSKDAFIKHLYDKSGLMVVGVENALSAF